jgi:hypothetical protein
VHAETSPDNLAFETGHPHDPALERRRQEVGRTVARVASLHTSKQAQVFGSVRRPILGESCSHATGCRG